MNGEKAMSHDRQNNNKKSKKNTKLATKISIIVIVCLLFNALYIIADYLNLFSLLGVNTKQINIAFTSIIVSNSIVVLLYMITYFSLDSRNITKRDNQRAIAELLLLSTYKSTSDSVKLFQDDKVAITALDHCQTNKLLSQDPVMQGYIDLPFKQNEMICGFAAEGIITADEFANYLKVKELYKDHIIIRIAFADAKSSENYQLIELMNILNENIEKYKATGLKV